MKESTLNYNVTFTRAQHLKIFFFHGFFFLTFMYSELRCGDSTECTVNILPLQIGMLILDGFHLNESNEESSAYNWDPHPHPLRDDNAPK